MKEDLKDISANRTSVSEGGEEFYNSRVSLLSVWELSDSSVPQLCREAPRRGWAQICPQPAVGKVEGGPTPPFYERARLAPSESMDYGCQSPVGVQ